MSILRKSKIYTIPALSMVMVLGQSQAQDDSDPEEEVFELSPFTVDGSEDNGYRGTHTMAGGRLKSELKDVATSVQVVTEQMIEDIGASSIDEILAYTTGSEAVGLMSDYGQLQDTSGGGTGVLDQSQARQNPAGAIRIRGLAAPTRTTNYFESAIPFNSYVSGRVDINRGANSFLFGLGSPGGIVNTTLQSAQLNDDSVTIKHKISTQDFEDNYSNEVSVNLNKVLIEDKLAVRFAALETENEYMQKPAYDDGSRRYVAVKFKPFSDRHINFNVNYETGDTKGTPVDRLSPLMSLDTFLDDPYGTVWGSTLDGEVTNASGRRISDPYGYFQAGISDNFLGLDAEGNSFNRTVYDQPLKRNGWASVYDGSSGRTDGLADLGVYTGWLNTVTESSPYYNPTNKNYNWNSSTLQRNFYLNNLNTGTLPEYTGFTSQGLVDYDVFDFSRNLISGSIDYTGTEFERRMLSLDAVSENGDFGIEIAYNNESSSRESFVGVSAPAIDIDMNYTLPAGPNELTGDLNPNFGRLYFYAASADKTLNADEREAFRATAFARVDFGDKFDGGILSKLGRHNITTLFDESRVETERLRHRPFVFGNNPDFHLSQDATIFQRAWSGVFYISDPYLDAFENPNFQLSDFSTDGLPKNTTLDFPDGFETQIAYISMGDPETEAGMNTVRNDEQTLIASFSPQFQPSSGTLTRTDVSSQALNLQSYLLGGHLVANLGWRKDTVTDIRNNEPPRIEGGEYNNIPILTPDVFLLENGMTEKADASNFGYGLVLKAPSDWLPDGMDVTAHYGESSNFDATPGGFDFDGNSVPGKDGTTREYGITLGLMDNKFVARLNHYESKVKNDQFRGVTNAAGVFVNQQARFYGFRYIELERWDQNRDGIFDDATLDANSNGYLDSIEDEAGAYMDNYASLPQFTEVFNNLDAFWTDFAQEAANFNPSPATADNDATFSSDSGLSTLLTDTVDLDAEGYELELTWNPTRQLRLSLNGSKKSVERTNIAPIFTEMLADFARAFSSVENGARMRGNGRNGLTTTLGGSFATNTTVAFPLNNGGQGQALFKQQAFVGADNPELSEYDFRFLGNYTFKEGAMKGAKFGGAYRWSDPTAIGYEMTTATFLPGELDVDIPVADITKPYYSEDNGKFDMWLGYRRKVFNDKANWNIQLNVRNVFGDSDPIVVQVQPDGSVARTMIPAVRQFVLSNTLEF